MTSPENFGPQFKDHIAVWRGLDLTHPDELHPKELGIHWSTDQRIAERFAADEDYANEQGVEPSGVLLHGYVHKDNVVKPYTDEWDELAGRHDILPPEESHEEEATVRAGSPVHVYKVEHVTPDGWRPTDKRFEGTA
jgi:hypothetical protein